MNSIRVKFLRGEEVKYISHLDLLKVFERALRRSHICIAYSQGFNPRPHMVFGLPLSVGVSSEAEYGDFELTEYMSPEEFTERLNNQLPKGLMISDAKEKQGKSNIMAGICAASYEILVSVSTTDIDTIKNKISEFINKPVITVKKETKNGVKDIDIKPMIHKIDIKAQSDLSVSMPIHSDKVVMGIRAVLSAGSSANLKPELLISALNQVSVMDIKIVKIHRTGLFVSNEGKITDPLDHSVLQ